ncbi:MULTISPECIES: TetR/AcrR family transcriptional regulator [unclassified Streptomyces]|uniref:TetR/AcrR family transcriptional regulator n=1 Tax=unclassified Streptomyces TaxID=2593676 RepID=UPI002E2AD23B|nr:TetR/AcrR family transcriptional regulator [Streptomyces sp. NBC_01439]
MSADERREILVRAAVVEFARGGYHGTSTESIARRGGVSQPYVFRLFPTKQVLFTAATDRCFRRVAEVLVQAAKGSYGVEALAAMADAYAGLLEERDVLLMQMQAYVVAASPEQSAFAEGLRQRWFDLWELVHSRSGATREELDAFFGSAMLINTQVALGAAVRSAAPR